MQNLPRVVLPFLEDERYDYTSIFDNFNFSVFKKVLPNSEQERNLEQITKCRMQNEFEIKEAKKLECKTFIYKAVDLKKSENVSLILYYDNKELEDEKNDDINEMVFLRKLEHPNIFKFYGVVFGNSIVELVFLFEPYHSLLSAIIDEHIDLMHETRIIKNIMEQLFKGLDYLHSKSAIHRAICPENILFTSTGVLKIWNFRNVRWVNQKKEKVKTWEYRYQPLELLLEFEACNTAVDIWSAGCIFAELLLKKMLFPMRERENVLAQIFAMLGFPTQKVYKELYDYPLLIDLLKYLVHHYNCLDMHMKKNCANAYTVPAMNLLHSCLMYNPKERITARECLDHEYFNEKPKACAQKLVKVLEASNINKALRQFKNKKRL